MGFGFRSKNTAGATQMNEMSSSSQASLYACIAACRETVASITAIARAPASWSDGFCAARPDAIA